MYSQEELKNIIRKRLSDYRYNHSICVSQKAVELAKKYGVDVEKARIAGILHDITKEDDFDYQRMLIEKDGTVMTSLELDNKKIYHQMSGSAYIKYELGIEDEDILLAVRYHTTGHANMTKLEMVVYLADFTSQDRDYPDVDIMRKKTDENMYNGMLYSLKHTITSLASHDRQIHPDTLNCYNWVLHEIDNRKCE